MPLRTEATGYRDSLVVLHTLKPGPPMGAWRRWVEIGLRSRKGIKRETGFSAACVDSARSRSL